MILLAIISGIILGSSLGYLWRKNDHLTESRREMYAYLFGLANEQPNNHTLRVLVDKYRKEFPETET